MKTTLITALLCTAILPLPCSHAQPSETDRQALAQLRAKAETGDVQSQFELGAVFSSGKLGVATNYVEAVKWFRKAADQNLPEAQYNLGVLYHEGRGVAQDDIEAVKWSRKCRGTRFPFDYSVTGGCPPSLGRLSIRLQLLRKQNERLPASADRAYFPRW